METNAKVVGIWNMQIKLKTAVVLVVLESSPACLRLLLSSEDAAQHHGTRIADCN